MDFMQLFFGLIGRILLGGELGATDAGSPAVALKGGASPESDG